MIERGTGRAHKDRNSTTEKSEKNKSLTADGLYIQFKANVSVT